MGAISGFQQYINQHFGFNKFKFTKRNDENIICATENNSPTELNLVAGEFIEFKTDKDNTKNKIIIRGTSVVWFKKDPKDGKYYDNEGNPLTAKRCNEDFNKRTIYINTEDEAAYIWRDNAFVRIIDYMKYNDIFAENGQILSSKIPDTFQDIVWFDAFADLQETNEDGTITIKSQFIVLNGAEIVLAKNTKGVGKKILVHKETGLSYKLKGGENGEWVECAAFKPLDTIQRAERVYFDVNNQNAFRVRKENGDLSIKIAPEENVLYYDIESSPYSQEIWEWHNGEFLLTHGLYVVQGFNQEYTKAKAYNYTEENKRYLPGTQLSLYRVIGTNDFYVYDTQKGKFFMLNDSPVVVYDQNTKTLTIRH